jgi:polysaccharide deacetylase 2 family uncharacterized protein YibQ
MSQHWLWRPRGGPGRPLAATLLYGVWALMLGGLATGAAVLQALGPPHATAEMPVAALHAGEIAPHSALVTSTVSVPKAAHPTVTPESAHAAVHVPAAAAPPPPPAPQPAPVRAPGTIAEPEPGLQEPSAQYPGARLPRIGPDQRTPLAVYAAPFTPSDPSPRAAILMAGMGMNEAETLAAIDALPQAVSLAFSPYAYRPPEMLRAARARGHEYLMSIPMEPQGYPLNDPGSRALMTGAAPTANAQNLEWVLSRFAGYIGATGALGDLRGERFAVATDQMAPLLDNLADRGLLYIDPRPNGSRPNAATVLRGAGRGIDLLLDDPPGRAELDRALARLEQLAKDRGAAIGLAGRPSPLNVSRIVAWSALLAGRGVVLAPVSAVVQMPQGPGSNPAAAMRTGLRR